MEYLGHLISGEGVRTDPRKTEAMQNWPTPTFVQALKGLLGLTGYYRKFIKNYGVIAAPLTALLKKDSFHWSFNAELAFNALKQAISNPPVLDLLDFLKPFVIECDASGYGFGAILMQDNKPLAYHSEALKGSCLHLSTYEKELLALVRLLRNGGLTWLAILFSLELISTVSNTSLNRELALLLNKSGSQSCWVILLWWSIKKGEKIELPMLFLECNLLLIALPKMLHFISFHSLVQCGWIYQRLVTILMWFTKTCFLSLLIPKIFL